jgi:bifunctional DNA-binding transcriptional regulator/antitoxin component of YhaV-PrlF toxin-antitoxin module
MESITLQMAKRGVITIPKSVRESLWNEAWR